MNRTIDFNTAPDSLLLTPAETAAFLGVALDTLNDWRYDKPEYKGPPYVKVRRAVRYPLGALHLWIANQTVEPNAATNVETTA
jgi:hypothetical protein